MSISGRKNNNRDCKKISYDSLSRIDLKLAKVFRYISPFYRSIIQHTGRLSQQFRRTISNTRVHTTRQFVCLHMIAAEKNSRRSHLTINDRFATVKFRIAFAVAQILLISQWILLTLKFGLPKSKMADLTNYFLHKKTQTNTFSTRSQQKGLDGIKRLLCEIQILKERCFSGTNE